MQHKPASSNSPAKPGRKLAWSDVELARRLGISARLVYTLREEEGLPFVRLRGRIVYLPAAVEAWLAARLETAAGPLADAERDGAGGDT